MSFATKPTGKRVDNFDLGGKLFMWEKGQPVLVHMHGDDTLCLPVFSSKDELVLAARDFGLTYETIKQIADPDHFLADIHATIPPVLLIAELRKHEGKVRYLLVKREMN